MGCPYPPHDFDALRPGQSFRTGPRLVRREDIDRFARLSGDRTALHTDDAYAASTALGGVAAHGVLTLAIATGLAYQAGQFEGTALAFRGLDATFERPVRPGDSLSLSLEVAEIDLRPRTDRGVGADAAEVSNQHGRRVLAGCWELVLSRGGRS